MKRYFSRNIWITNCKKFCVLLGMLTVLVLFFSGCVSKSEQHEWEIIQYSDLSGNQAMFYSLYEKETSTLIIIDGGWSENTEQVRQVINEYGGVVSAWFLTHYHSDHIGAFNEIYADPEGIIIEKIYDSPISYEEYAQVAQYWDTPECLERYLELTDGAENVQHLTRNSVINFEGLKCTVFNTYDDYVKDNGDVPNNLSLMLKFEGSDNSILFCGDCYGQIGDLLMEMHGELLQSDYVQLGHHGNNSLTEEFYEFVNPKEVFFDAPEWLMTGEGYNAKDYAKFFESKGVEYYDYSSAPNKIIIR